MRARETQTRVSARLGYRRNRKQCAAGVSTRLSPGYSDWIWSGRSCWEFDAARPARQIKLMDVSRAAPDIPRCRAWLMYVCVPVPSFDASWGRNSTKHDKPWKSCADLLRGTDNNRPRASSLLACCPSGRAPISHRYARYAACETVRLPGRIGASSQCSCSSYRTCKHPASRW